VFASRWCWNDIKQDPLLCDDAHIGLLLIKSWRQRLRFVFLGVCAVPYVFMNWLFKDK
jgi:hypothetical protein